MSRFPRHLLWAALAATAVACAAEGSAPPVDDDAALAEKLNAYIGCGNRHDNMAFKSRERYLSWVRDPEQGPTGRENIVYGLYTLYDPADCYAALANAADQPPDLPELEAEAKRYVETLRALKQAIDEAHDYYDLEDYRDDGFAKGKRMHAGLMQAWADFEDTAFAMSDRVGVMQRGLVERALERMKADPARQREYAAELLLLRARQMVDTGATSQEALDLAAFQATVAAYEEAYRNAMRFENDSDGQKALPSVVLSGARELLKTAKAYVRRAQGGFEYDSGERMFLDSAPEMVEGHPAQLVSEFNQLVNWSNSMLR